MHREFRAVIFDFDGTIVDTETPEYEAWRSVFEDHGCELPVSVWADCIGTADSGFDPFLYLLEQAGRPLDRDTIQAQRRQRNYGSASLPSPLAPLGRERDRVRGAEL